MPDELARWEQALGWLPLLRDRPDEQQALAAWAMLRARHRPLALVLRRRNWSRSTFYRLATRGAERIAQVLNGVRRSFRNENNRAVVETCAVASGSAELMTSRSTKFHLTNVGLTRG